MIVHVTVWQGDDVLTVQVGALFRVGGSASNSSSARTSSNVGHFGVPMRRTSFSTEIVFGAGIMRPFSSKERNAMLQLAPRGEIAVPIAELEDLQLLDVKMHKAHRVVVRRFRPKLRLGLV